MSEDFFVIREEWNSYGLLPTHDKLRVKVMLSGVQLAGENQARFEFSQIMKKEPSTDDKGTPSSDQTVTPEDAVEHVTFERIFESLNIYDCPSLRKLIMVKPILVTFTKSSKFDSKGDRIYVLDFRMAVSPIDYPPEASEIVPST